jgi:hypothetical protein
MRRLAIAAALAAIALASTAARANGRFPAAGQVLVDPGDAKHLVVRATYGLVATRDAGASWAWICEGAVGIGPKEDPMVGVTAHGGLVASLYAGVRVSSDGGCTFADRATVPGALGADLSVDRGDPRRVHLLVDAPADDGTFGAVVLRSDDEGAIFHATGAPLPERLGLTIDASTAKAGVVWATAIAGSGAAAKGVLLRSEDAGATFAEAEIPGASAAAPPYIAGVDPKVDGVVYVRIDGASLDTLLVTKDAGASWTTLRTSVDLPGFALSPDGATVLAGGETDGLWRAPAATLAFEKISPLKTTCLAWVGDAIYACADELTEPFSVGVSHDGGATFSPLYRRRDLCGPLACPAGSSVAETCPAAWDATRATLGASTCAAAGGAGGAGGSASAGGSGGGASAGGSGATTSSPSGAAAGASASDGGGCATGRGQPRDGRGGGPSAPRSALIALALALAARRRR